MAVVRLERCGTKGLQTIPPVGNFPELALAVYPYLLADDHATEPLVKATRAPILFEHPETQRFESARKQRIRKRDLESRPQIPEEDGLGTIGVNRGRWVTFPATSRN